MGEQGLIKQNNKILALKRAKYFPKQQRKYHELWVESPSLTKESFSCLSQVINWTISYLKAFE